MEDQEQFVSRQVRRREERLLDKAMGVNRRRRLSSKRTEELRERKTKREVAAATERKAARMPVANLIGKKRICQGWFHRGLFR